MEVATISGLGCFSSVVSLAQLYYEFLPILLHMNLYPLIISIRWIEHQALVLYLSH